MRLYDGSKRWWVLVSVFAALVISIGWGGYWGLRQQRDKAAVRDYIKKLQPELLADRRFKEVQLLGYSCDYIRYPYIPVLGRVASQKDWDALNTLVRESKPPAYITLQNVIVDTNLELVPSN